VDAFPVHGGCGIWGTLALGLFGNPDEGLGGNGLFYGGDQIGTQIFGVFMIFLWVGCLSTLLFWPLRQGDLLRLSDDFQDLGADVLEHSPRKAYHETTAAKEAKVTEDKAKPSETPINV